MTKSCEPKQEFVFADDKVLWRCALCPENTQKHLKSLKKKKGTIAEILFVFSGIKSLKKKQHILIIKATVISKNCLPELPSVVVVVGGYEERRINVTEDTKSLVNKLRRLAAFLHSLAFSHMPSRIYCMSSHVRAHTHVHTPADKREVKVHGCPPFFFFLARPRPPKKKNQNRMFQSFPVNIRISFHSPLSVSECDLSHRLTGMSFPPRDVWVILVGRRRRDCHTGSRLCGRQASVNAHWGLASCAVMVNVCLGSFCL